MADEIQNKMADETDSSWGWRVASDEEDGGDSSRALPGPSSGRDEDRIEVEDDESAPLLSSSRVSHTYKYYFKF